MPSAPAHPNQLRDEPYRTPEQRAWQVLTQGTAQPSDITGTSNGARKFSYCKTDKVIKEVAAQGSRLSLTNRSPQCHWLRHLQEHLGTEQDVTLKKKPRKKTEQTDARIQLLNCWSYTDLESLQGPFQPLQSQQD